MSVLRGNLKIQYRIVSERANAMGGGNLCLLDGSHVQFGQNGKFMICTLNDEIDKHCQ